MFQECFSCVLDIALSSYCEHKGKQIESELGELGTESKVSMLDFDISKCPKKQECRVFEVFAEVEGGWPVAKAIRNMVPMLVAV